MRELGEYLKQMREGRGLTAEEVSEKTKINLQYIKALEEGNWEDLPPKIYVKGFVKSYGQLLGADVQDLYSRFEKSLSDDEATTQTDIKREEIKDSGETQKGSSSAFSFGDIPNELIFIALIIFIGILSVTFLLKNGKNTASQSATAISNFEKQKSKDEWNVSFKDRQLSQTVRVDMDDINPARALGRTDSLTLTIKATKNTWVLVETDYRREFKGTMYEGQKKDFRAKNAFFLTLGKPSGVKLQINGFDLKPFKPSASPKDVEVTRANVLDMLKGHEQTEVQTRPDSAQEVSPKEKALQGSLRKAQPKKDTNLKSNEQAQ